MVDFQRKERYTVQDLEEIVRILRDPDFGCPWDKVQTHASIRKDFLEETCEVLEAIDREDPTLLKEELGDVMMQVMLHSRMEEEAGRFCFEDVCDGICKKLVFRHPHVFGHTAENAGLNSWQALKDKEKGLSTLGDELDSIPATLPALMYAEKLVKRARRFGAQEDRHPGDQAAKAAAALEQDNSPEAFGRALFWLAAAAARAGVCPEEALEQYVKA
ncbi:MAG: MazG family protein, partial [Oscillospiraceae bacterium]|nr:MazG family protein [Oscillospiraceae bacterium]